MLKNIREFLIEPFIAAVENKKNGLFKTAGWVKEWYNMSNPILEYLDKAETIKDIAERNEIILNYQKYGILDRNNAIQKIKELRIKDPDVSTITFAKLAISNTPFEHTPNDQLVSELAMQRDILLAKLGNNKL